MVLLSEFLRWIPLLIRTSRTRGECVKDDDWEFSFESSFEAMRIVLVNKKLLTEEKSCKNFLLKSYTLLGASMWVDWNLELYVDDRAPIGWSVGESTQHLNTSVKWRFITAFSSIYNSSTGNFHWPSKVLGAWTLYLASVSSSPKSTLLYTLDCRESLELIHFAPPKLIEHSSWCRWWWSRSFQGWLGFFSLPRCNNVEWLVQFHRLPR